MANQGLRRCIQQKQVRIGGATAYINPYREDANFLLTLPIFSTVGYAPIQLSFIYNHQSKEEEDLFGKGFKLNYYKKLAYISPSEIGLTNADGSTERYTLKDGYYTNKETHLHIVSRYDYDEESTNTTYYYDLCDESGNYMTYEEPNLKYPQWIKPVSGEHICLDLEKNNYCITNVNGDTVLFRKGNTGFVEIIEWKREEESRLTAFLSYQNSRLTSVIVKNSSTAANSEVASYHLNITDTMIEIKDNLIGADTKFMLDGNKVIQIEEGFHGRFDQALITTIQYDGTRTTMTDPHRKVSTIVYDKEGLTRLVKDDKENFVAYTYDMNTKALLAATSLPKPNQTKNLLNGKSIGDFTRYGSLGLTEDYGTIEAFYQTHAGTKCALLNGTGSAKYTLHTSFLPTDTITLIIWAKQKMPCVVGSVSGYVQLTSGDKYVNQYFNKSVLDDEYFPFVMGFTFTEAADSVDISIHCSTYFSLEIASIQLYKRNFGVFYQYDSKGNVISSSISGNETTYSYENGVVKGKRSWTNHGVTYQRDSRHRLTEAVGAYQTRQSFTYTDNNQIRTSKTENFQSTAIFETAYEYENDDRKVTYTDESGNTTIEEKDSFFQVIKVTNSVNQVLESTLGDSFELKNLTLLTKTTSHLNASYTYEADHPNLVKTITMKNGMKYTFSYDEKDRIRSISLNDLLLVTYTYDRYDQISTMQYGRSDPIISFTYTDEEQIKTIQMGSIVYTYTYNDLGSLTSITDGENTWEYTYNEDNQVEELNFKQSEQKTLGLQYTYDNLGNVNQEQETIFDCNHIQEYEGLYRSNGCNAENLVSKLEERSDFVSCMFIGNDVCLRKKDVIIKPFLNGKEVESASTELDEAIPCLSVGSNTYKYRVGYPRTNGGSFGFWYKFSYYPNSPVLLMIADGSSSDYIHLYINSEHQLAVQMKQSTTTNTIYNSTFRASESGWHFLGFNWYCDGNTTYFLLFFDGEIAVFSVNKKINMASPEYTIFYSVGGKVSGVISGIDQLLTVEQLNLFYRSTKDYVFNKVKKNSSLDFSCATHYLAPNGFTLWPLHHDLKSLDGQIPYRFGLRKVIVADSDRTFNYNSAIGRYAYIADGALLEYKLENSGTATIGLRVYIESIRAAKQYLFEIYDYQTTIALYVNAEGKLCLECFGHTVTTNLSLRTKNWNFVGFSFSQSIASDSLSLNSLAVRVVVETNEYTTTISFGNPMSSSYCSIGRKHQVASIATPFGSYEESYALHGQIEMLAFGKNYSSSATLSELKTNLELTDKITGYNEFQMPSSSVLKIDQQELIRTTWTYRSNPENTKKKCWEIAYETNYFYGKGTNTRTYETDHLGRVTKVTDSFFSNHTYSYDEKGYLKSEDATNYCYDDNGNILSAGTKIYEYKGTIKDRLTKALGYEVTYQDEINPGNPISWNGKQYGWDCGRRLMLFQDHGNTTSYSYTADGLRSSKTHQGVTTQYFYSGKRLIAEKTPSYKLNFLYDENGILYGFVKDNRTKYYYYIRDVYQNILGIMDNTGAIVVKYNCDAWGNHEVLDGNGNKNTSETFIGNINPFRYKGYYYDKESNMYYCKSRYYVPEWGRFLNSDSIEYLDPQSINGLNLYAYCGNDPVNYADPSGHSVILAMLIGAGIGLVVGLGSQLASDVISNVLSNGFDFSEWKMSTWQTYVGAGLGGAIGGALTPFLGPVATGFITGTSSTAISMGLSNVIGTSNYSLGEIFATSLLIGSVSGITAGILDNVKMPGINSGRGSLTAVSKQINTKLVNGSIKNVSIKTIGKMATLNTIYSAPFIVFNGLFTNGVVLSPSY